MTNINNIIKKHQQVVANFEFPEKEREFKKLEELHKAQPKARYTILAIFINTKGKFGDQGVFITNDFQVNLPPHLLDLSQELRQDEEVIEAINNRELAFEIYQYNGKNGKGYSINLVPSTEQNEKDDSKGRAFDNDEELAF